jgi:hypothetical protein
MSRHYRVKARPTFVVARGPMRWFLRACDGLAITMPWRRVYVLEEHRHDLTMIRHELVHLEQIDRDGPLLFSLKYLYWLARHGYRRNPYEIEAYERERP